MDQFKQILIKKIIKHDMEKLLEKIEKKEIIRKN